MKKLLMGLFLLAGGVGAIPAGSAFAQGNFYRIFDGNLHVGETAIPVSFKVNETIVEERFGDPEIPNHGFIRKSISIQMVEGRLSCDGLLGLESGEMRSCSGLVLRLQDPTDLLAGKTARGRVRLTSSDVHVGTLQLRLKYTEAGDHTNSYDE